MTEKTISITEHDIDLPLVKILTGRGFITGKSGSGKSNTAGKICEEVLDEGYPLLVIDTEGEYYGLKEQYELLHVGADEECDLQVGAEHAEKIAELALEENVPIILDVSGYVDTEEVDQLVHDTVKKLFDKEKKLKKPFPILVEEAHEWIPQQGSRGEEGEVTDMLVRVGKRGRKRGLGLCALSQRPASVDKDYITQCDYRIWHRLDYETDLKVVKRVLGNKYAETVKELDTGQGVLEADFLDENRQVVDFLRKQTFDAGATPDLEDFERPELKSVSSDLVGELEEISEQKKREQNRIEQLESQLEAKEEEIDELEEQLDRAQDMSDMAEQFTQAMASGGSAEVQEKVDEIREEKNSRIRELEKENEQYQERIEELEEKVSDLKEYEEVADKVQDWEEKRDVVREALLRLKDELDIEVDGNVENYQKRIKKQEEKIQKLKEKLENGAVRDQSDFVGSERYENLLENIANRKGHFSKTGGDKVMRELEKGPATLTQLSNATGYSQGNVKSNIIPSLKQQGWVKEKSDDKYRLTEDLK
jgi:hypothetical protein